MRTGKGGGVQMTLVSNPDTVSPFKRAMAEKLQKALAKRGFQIDISGIIVLPIALIMLLLGIVLVGQVSVNLSAFITGITATVVNYWPVFMGLAGLAVVGFFLYGMARSAQRRR